ncbi:sigma-70 family RNA polymerase sigma factor (plasmid) [Chitinophaga sp. Mgbs1]|uniref:Sigma-70 family RNA polymerase sigma factor n=1 Tax=Chitinophaga solisilvae TaxID=1233460 RepID=A0A9Q5GX94_9BACT|nr:sigma-70 family RNA polymerase sigma factor [Chitinophaga solisilvae]
MNNHVRENESAILLSRVALGDEQAFTALFDQWHTFLATHIFRITASRQLAEEVVQDVFLKIWHNRATLTEITHIRAYLLTMSKNHALNALQKKVREYRQWEQWAREHTMVADQPDPSASMYSLIDDAIDKLSPRQKEIWLLHRHQRMTYQEIAAHLGIGRETVKTHLESAVRAISRHVRLQLAITTAAICMLQ